MRFAFYGRVSTEDQQDPEASRNWQLTRAQALIERHGPVVAEFFDIGQSRSIPWKRRPQAAALLDRLKSHDRGFGAVVIGEPQRAFYGNQYGLTFPVFVHYGVQLWVPEVGGAIDPESEAHDLVMSVFGGMSKAERNRIRIRVRTAMAAQAHIEGRFLGGRPPYGYQLVDAGLHPNPAKAADGKRLRRLEPDPMTAAVVQRIFAEYLAGRGIFAIAEALTRDGVPSPSAHDPARNRHRCTVAWSKAAVRTILSNPRYTGRQVWNKQRKDDVLINVEDVALGHVTKMRWNPQDAWVWSSDPTHEPLIDTQTFQRAQEVLAAHGAGRTYRERRTTEHHYVFRGLLHCGVCGRRMQGQQNKHALYYRCRFPTEYALANKIDHPRNVYLAERDLLRPLDQWLSTSFAPDQLPDTIEALYNAQPHISNDSGAVAAEHVIQDCDAKLTRYRAALEAGADPQLVTRWIAEVQARRAEALVRCQPSTGRQRMSQHDIGELIQALGNIPAVLATATPEDKAQLYSQLGLHLTYEPAQRLIRAETRINPHSWGYGSCPRRDLRTNHPYRSRHVWLP
jgi:DNA invertase Pin-like site-specific DNA recombinase